MGGGLVRGSVVLLAGEPGAGKSTLLLQLIAGTIERQGRCLLATGEESLHQVALRAARLGVDLDAVRALATDSLATIVAAVGSDQPDVLIVDSIQAIAAPDFDQSAGSQVQVRECAATLVRLAKVSGMAVILVGHVTKDGMVAGPKTLEHVVDVVLSLEGERSGPLRLLRAAKNRFGSCDETGVMLMTKTGLVPVADPSAMFLEDRDSRVSGSAIFPALQGTRPVLAEVQALVTTGQSTQPRVVAIGLDPKRLALLLGVLAEHGGVRLPERDVFVAAAGGLTIRDPAADLALCLAVNSSQVNMPLGPRTVALGEVGLGGEIRRVPMIERRLAEAARLGFHSAIVPRRHERVSTEIELIEVADLRSALVAVSDRARESAA